MNKSEIARVLANMVEKIINQQIKRRPIRRISPKPTQKKAEVSVEMNSVKLKFKSTFSIQLKSKEVKSEKKPEPTTSKVKFQLKKNLFRIPQHQK